MFNRLAKIGGCAHHVMMSKKMGTVTICAFALGATAIGALVIGVFAIGKLKISKASAEVLDIDILREQAVNQPT